MNILIVHNEYKISGGEDSVVENECKMLQKNGHKVYKYIRNNDELDTILGKIKFLFSFLYSRRSYKDVCRLIESYDIDIMHVHNIFPLITASVYDTAEKKKIPIIQTLHNFRLLCAGAVFVREGRVCEECVEKGIRCGIRNKCYRNSRLQTIMATLTMQYNRKKKVYDKVDAYIALTEFNKNKFYSLLPMQRVFVKPNFVDVAKEVSNKKDYLFVGRIEWIKGIEVLISAFERMPDETLNIIGTGPQDRWLENIVKEKRLKNISILGARPHEDVMHYINTAKALIIPSQWYEGFPVIVVEAYSQGTPIIAGRIGNLEGLIEDEGTGLLFEYNSAKDLINAVKRLSGDPALQEKTSQKAQTIYLDKYTEKVNYKKMMEIYKFALGRKNSSTF